MGLSWQQGPLAPGAIGRFLVPEPLPERLLYIEPLRRRMRVRFGGAWIADSENVLLLFEPGRYPVAYFPEADVSPEVLERSEHTTKHPDLGHTSWYLVKAAGQRALRGAWQHVDLPAFASDLGARIAFAWRAMDAFYEVTIELTSAKLRAISWFVIATASSRTLSGLWSSTSPVLLRAGTFRVSTSMSPLLPSWNIKPFVPTKASAATTTSATRGLRDGRIAKPILKLVGFPA